MCLKNGGVPKLCNFFLVEMMKNHWIWGSIEQIGVSGNVFFPCLSPFFCVNAVMWKILRYSEQPWDLELFPKLSDKSSCTIFPCTTRRRWHVPCGPGKRPRRGPEVVGGDAVHGTEWLTSWNAIKIGDWVKLQPWAFQPFFQGFPIWKRATLCS